MEGKYATEYVFYTPLTTAGSQGYQTNPTIAVGDFQVSTDGSGWTNLDTLPALSPAADIQVKVVLSIAEMTGKKVTIRAIDVAGSEWEMDFWEVDTYGHASALHVNDLAQSDILSDATPFAGANIDQALSTMEDDTRGADADDLKTISDQLDHLSILDKTSFYTWPTYAPIAITLFVVDPGTGLGLPGQVPYTTLTIRRANDAKYWGGTEWKTGSSDLTMTEVDETEEPGLYQYVLPAAANDQEALYIAHANVDNPPTVEGDSYEIHESRIFHDPSEGSPFDPTSVLP